MQTKRVLLFLPLILYLLALNPYVEPNTYDNIVYLDGAKSLVTEGRYAFQGDLIVDWPPLMSLFLAIPYALGLTSTLAAKVVVLLFVCLGMWMTWRVLLQDGFEFPLLAYLIAMLSPILLLWSSRVMTEWPYLALSLLFLYALDQLEKKRTFSLAIVTGLALAASLLMRYIGVALLAPLLTVLIQRLVAAYRQNKSLSLKPIGLELLVGVLGVGLFMGLWLLPIIYLQHIGHATAKYYEVSKFTSVQPVNFLHALGDLISKIEGPASNPLLYYSFVGLITLLIAAGMISQIHTRAFRKTDAYVLAYLLCLLYTWFVFTRYLLPIAPFIFSYLISGVALIGKMYRNSKPYQKPEYWAATLLIALFLIGDALLLTRGNGDDYGGLNIWASPSAEKFYRHHWADIYAGSTLIKESAPGDVAVLESGDMKYIYYFSGRTTFDFTPYRQASFLVASNTPITEHSALLMKEWQPLKIYNSISVYERKKGGP